MAVDRKLMRVFLFERFSICTIKHLTANDIEIIADNTENKKKRDFIAELV